MEANEANYKLLTNRGYFERFRELYLTAPTQKRAWELVERELATQFGLRKYDSYNSFAKALRKKGAASKSRCVRFFEA